MRNIQHKWLKLFALLLLLLGGVILWLGNSSSALNWSYQQLRSSIPGQLQFESLQGKLFGPVKITQLDYQLDGLQFNSEQLIFDWQPLSLLRGKINIRQIILHNTKIEQTVTTPETTEPNQPPFSLPEIDLPWQMELQQLQMDSVQLKHGTEIVELQQLTLSASALFGEITINQLSVQAEQFNAKLNGTLRPSGNYRHRLNLNWQAQRDDTILSAEGSFEGDRHITQLTQQFTSPLQGTLNIELSEPLTELSWQATLDASEVKLDALYETAPTFNGSLAVKAKGDLQTAELSTSLAGQFSGDPALLGEFKAEFNLRGSIDGPIQLQDLQLQHRESATETSARSTQLSASGEWQPNNNTEPFKLKLSWQNLYWPLQASPWFNSAQGKASVAGNLQHYRFQIQTEQPFAQSPASVWTADGSGSLQDLKFDSLRVVSDHGELLATGQLDWKNHFNWEAELQASNINPAGLMPTLSEFSGKLDAKLSSKGEIKEQLTSHTQIHQLTGTLRDYPVTLRSQFTWQNDGLDIKQLAFSSGTAQVHAQGRLGMGQLGMSQAEPGKPAKQWDLNWRIDATELAELYPEASGEFHASGSLQGSADAPLISSDFKASSLRLQEYQIGELDGTVSLDLFHWQKIKLQVSASDLAYQDYQLQSLQIVSDGQQMSLNAQNETDSLQIEVSGQAINEQWQGKLLKANLLSQHYGQWRLKAPAELTLAARSLNIAPLCWRDTQQAEFCASIKGDKRHWQSSLTSQNFPLLPFSHWLSPELKFNGTAHANAQLQLTLSERLRDLSAAKLRGFAQLDLPEGNIQFPPFDIDSEALNYNKGKINIQLNDEGIDANAQLDIQNSDGLQIEVALPGANALDIRPQQTINSKAQLQLHKLTLIEVLIPELQHLQGELTINASTTGTLKQPKLATQIQLQNAQVQVPQLGLNIKQLSLNGHTDDQQQLQFHASARSGDGELVIRGHTLLNAKRGWPTELSIQGKAVEVARIPEAVVHASPDLQLKIQQGKLDVRGDVHIPYARLQPKDISSSVTVSNDVVIVGGESKPEDGWHISSRIRLTLGNRVNFYGFGFEGRFTGSLLIIDQPGELTTATGEINIPEGRYRAYGQRLDIADGRLLFSGGPIGNPGLDIRAVRVTGNVTAGIKARGSLNQPILELFSIPAMGETDTLSYLLLGRPMENTTDEEGATMAKAALALGLAGGDKFARLIGDRFGLDEMRVESSDGGDQASLVMGRYLSPKLYISYGVGLVEAFNTFAVRYQLSEKWQLKAESGEAQGADLFYTIER